MSEAMVDILAFYVPADTLGIVLFNEEDVAESVMNVWSRWFERNEDKLPDMYEGTTVLIGEFNGHFNEATRGYDGTFTSGDKSYTVVDSVVHMR